MFVEVNHLFTFSMRFPFVLFLFSFLFANCKAPNAITGQTIALKTNFPVSANTEIFLHDLKEEMEQSNTNEFVPSTQLLKRFQLQKIRDQYFIHGFIKTDSSFNGELLKRSGATVQSTSGNIKTILVNLRSLPDFLKQPGITYFEIGNKLHLHKQ